jgi:hypothetical protein
MLNGGKWMSSLDLYRSNPVLIVGPREHHWLDAGAQLAVEFRRFFGCRIARFKEAATRVSRKRHAERLA